MGQTARVLLKEAVHEEGPVAEDSDDAANPLWGQREDKQIQVCARWVKLLYASNGFKGMPLLCCSVGTAVLGGVAEQNVHAATLT